MYHVQLKQFEGPLDLLLHLISRAKINICDIFISEITEQYLQSIEDLSDLDMETASEFLIMAATLIEIKSRALLPKPPKEEEGEETPEEALIRRLNEYKAFKEGAVQMQAFEQAAKRMFQKLPEEYPLPPPTFELSNLTMDGLLKALERVMLRALVTQGDKEMPAREIRRDSYSVQECMFTILTRVAMGPCLFDELMSGAPTRNEIVSLFFAMLELLRLHRVTIRQEEAFGEIQLLPGKAVHDKKTVTAVGEEPLL